MKKSSVIVNKVLLSNGILPNMKGFSYCFDILMRIKDGMKMKDLYVELSQKYCVLPNSIEKSVSNAIEKAFGKIEILQKYADKCNKDGKISNKKFFYELYVQIKDASD